MSAEIDMTPDEVGAWLLSLEDRLAAIEAHMRLRGELPPLSEQCDEADSA